MKKRIVISSLVVLLAIALGTVVAFSAEKKERGYGEVVSKKEASKESQTEAEDYERAKDFIKGFNSLREKYSGTDELLKKLEEYFIDSNLDEKILLLVQQEFAEQEGSQRSFGYTVTEGFLLEKWEKELPKIQVLTEKILPIVSNPEYSDDMRASYVTYTNSALIDLHNKKIFIEEKDREKIINTLMKIAQTKDNSSYLRSQALFAITISGRSNKVFQAITKALDEQDEMVLERLIHGIGFGVFRNNEEIISKLLSMLKNREAYSDNITITLIGTLWRIGVRADKELHDQIVNSLILASKVEKNKRVLTFIEYKIRDLKGSEE